MIVVPIPIRTQILIVRRRKIGKVIKIVRPIEKGKNENQIIESIRLNW